ncbi:hypothetical protein D3C73_845810 [compost metagenome]
MNPTVRLYEAVHTFERFTSVTDVMDTVQRLHRSELEETHVGRVVVAGDQRTEDRIGSLAITEAACAELVVHLFAWGDELDLVATGVARVNGELTVELKAPLFTFEEEQLYGFVVDGEQTHSHYVSDLARTTGVFNHYSIAFEGQTINYRLQQGHLTLPSQGTIDRLAM